MLGGLGRWWPLLWGALALGGCATNVVTLSNPPTAGAVVAGQEREAAVTPVAVQLVVAPLDDQARAGADLTVALHDLGGTSVFFETGKSAITADGRVKLLRIAEVLRNNPGLKVRIEGNADERGPAGYNLELGARRARAARDFLVSVEVKPEQVVLVSNGEDKPLATGHDEESWQVNRRSDVNLVQDKAPEAAGKKP